MADSNYNGGVVPRLTLALNLHFAGHELRVRHTTEVESDGGNNIHIIPQISIWLKIRCEDHLSWLPFTAQKGWWTAIAVHHSTVGITSYFRDYYLWDFVLTCS